MREVFEGSSLGLTRKVVTLAPSDPRWAEVYARLEPLLRSALDGLAVAIEHVGSTAVPGLPAKPILDVAVGVPASLDTSRLVAPLEALGFLYRGADEEDPHLVFGWEDPPRHRLVNLHVVVHEGRRWREYVEFRDHLRTSPAVRAAYEALKADLAGRFPGDRNAYVDGKDEFVAAVLARTWGERG